MMKLVSSNLYSEGCSLDRIIIAEESPLSPVQASHPCTLTFSLIHLSFEIPNTILLISRGSLTPTPVSCILLNPVPSPVVSSCPNSPPHSVVFHQLHHSTLNSLFLTLHTKPLMCAVITFTSHSDHNVGT